MKPALRTAMPSRGAAAAVGGLALCLILLVQLSACSGRSRAPVVDVLQPPSAADVPEVALEVGDDPPQGVDAALWVKLVSELERVLQAEGTARRSAAAPTGKGSSVRDLGLYTVTGSTYYPWSYRNQGDYDLNGEVNINDLTQVGLHFGKHSLSADWQQAQLADGDGNMEVNIADITPMGQNFGGRVDGYELQRSPDGVQPFALMAEYGFIPGDPTTGLYPHYEHTGPLVIFGPSYRVVPYVEDGGQREYGVESNRVGSGYSLVSRWHTARGNNMRDGMAGVAGPASAGGFWSVELEGVSELSLFAEPVVDRTGMIYLGTLSQSVLTELGPGHFYAVSPEGDLEWTFTTAAGIGMSAAANRSGRIVVGDLGGMVYCFAPDGKQIWRQQIAGALLFSGPLLDDLGTVFILSHTISGQWISSSTLFKLTPDGEIEWSRGLEKEATGSPFFNPVGHVTAVDELGKVYSFDYAGGSTFNFNMPDALADSLNAKGALLHGDSIGYSTLNETVRFVNYDNSASFFVAPQGERPISMPALNHQSRIVFVSQTTVGDTVNRLNYYNGNVEEWDIDLPGNFATNVAIDRDDRMYVGTALVTQGSPVGTNGVHCVLPDQTISWFHPLDQGWVFSVVVASKGLVVCTSVAEGLGGNAVKLTGIHE